MKLNVTAYPYATVFGQINVPDGMTDAETEDYLVDHWEEIDFNEPELDYGGCEIEFD